MNEGACSFRYEMWECPRPAVWEGLCRVHAAAHLRRPINPTEGTDHGNLPSTAL